MEMVAKSCYFVWAIKKTFRIFSLRDLRFVFCSIDHDVLRAQRIMVFLISQLPTEINEVRSHGMCFQTVLAGEVATLRATKCSQSNSRC